ncbi:MAG: hypothetical protein MUF45_02205 [Spirosomaceae bacterium]|nr:hypothetical protein [Spirosomataceae bacterium]
MKNHFLKYIIILFGYNTAVFAQNLDQIGKQKPFAISGNIDLRSILYSASGIENRRSPFSYILTGSPTLSIYGIAIPVSFTYSEQERSFRQPFNQFGMSPTYKWATLHAGYRNISFSPYTLGGHTMLGGGFELNPKNLRLGFMTGRLSKAMDVDSVSGESIPLNFSRFGTSFKIGYGNEKNHFDISVLKAKDTEKGFKGDINTNKLRPAENLVLGSELKIELFKKLTLNAEAGYSIYTLDYTSTLAVTLDSSNFFVDKIGKLMKLNVSTERYGAYSGGITYREKSFSIKVGYQYVDPNFQTMGAYFFQNDIQNFTLSPTINLLKGKLRLMGSIGLQNDNLKEQKQATTKRVIGMGNLSWDINNIFGLDANYTNFSSNSTPTVQQVQNKYLLAQTTGNLSLTPRIILAGEQNTQTIILSLNKTSMVDANETTKSLNQINSTVALLNHTFTHNASGLSINSGVNYIQNEVAGLNIKNYGGSIGASKSFLKNKIQISTSNSYLINTSEQGKGKILNISLNGSYQPVSAHRFSLRVVHLGNSLTSSSNPVNFKENTGELAYTFNF